jgi:aspartate racemase
MRPVDFQLVVDSSGRAAGTRLAATRPPRPAARALEAAGASFIVVCTVPMRLVVPAIGAAVIVPFLHVIDAAGRIRAVGCRRPLLRATCYTMEQGF